MSQNIALYAGAFARHTDSSLFFTPSNTAKQNYMYLQSAGCTDAGQDYSAEFKGVDSFLLLYTLSGTGEIEYMDRHYFLSEGEGFLLDCHQHHAYRTSSGGSWNFAWFNMNGQSFSVYYNQLISAHKGPFLASEGTVPGEIMQKLMRCARLKSSMQSELLTSTAIIDLLTELITMGGGMEDERISMPAYVEGIVELINANYRNQITLDALAAEFNVSKYHLSREFKRYTGFSPNEYVISVRINRAKELLRHTDHSVAEIAQMTGCGDTNHFIQLFKSREKLTPAVFRRNWDGFRDI